MPKLSFSYVQRESRPTPQAIGFNNTALQALDNKIDSLYTSVELLTNEIVNSATSVESLKGKINELLVQFEIEPSEDITSQLECLNLELTNFNKSNIESANNKSIQIKKSAISALESKRKILLRDIQLQELDEMKKLFETGKNLIVKNSKKIQSIFESFDDSIQNLQTSKILRGGVLIYDFEQIILENYNQFQVKLLEAYSTVYNCDDED